MLKKAANFRWNPDSDQGLTTIKSYMSNFPTLSELDVGKEMFLYLEAFVMQPW